MSTRIVFSEGPSVTVSADAEDVKTTLGEDKRSGEPFTHFEAQGGRDVYVAAERVAYVEQMSSTATR